MPSGNGAKPTKTSEQVAAELRRRLERRLGRERTEAIWQDPANVQQVVKEEGEAVEVAQIMLQAWRDLPADEPGTRRRTSRFRRALQLAIVAAMAAWAVAVLRRRRGAG
jgi:hypothetical protein